MPTRPTHKATVYCSEDGLWRYRVRARNGRIVDDSEQGFRQKRSVMSRLARDWPRATVTVLP